LDNTSPVVQLKMVWPEYLLQQPPEVFLPAGYNLRTFQAGDEPQFYRLMELAGWPGWDAEQLRPWQNALLDNNWFVAEEIVSGRIVASAMGLHDPADPNPEGSELGWVAGDPAHAGQGLGRAVCSAVTRRLIESGHQDIYLLTDDWRIPALKTYLKMGYVPLLFRPEMAERWQAICAKLGWPFTPEKWPTTRFK
jgi:mycothiol synthase